jgi:hypothetical protein
MRLSVTIKPDENLEQIRPLIEAVRHALTAENVIVLEAPNHIDYSYPFPIVSVSEGPEQGRHFGSEALELLRAVSQGRKPFKSKR